MNTILWIVQGILAAMFLMAGVIKTRSTHEKLKASMPWAARFPLSTIRIIGVSEFLGGLGLVLPQLTGVAVVLTPLAAIALAIIQLLAMVHHGKHDENKAIVFNTVLLLMAIFIAVGRFNFI